MRPKAELDAVTADLRAEPCAACYHEAFLHTKSGECMEWKCACGRFEAESPAVAEKSPDECSICRGRHGECRCPSARDHLYGQWTIRRYGD